MNNGFKNLNSNGLQIFEKIMMRKRCKLIDAKENGQ